MSDNLAEKAAKAREAKEAAERAKRKEKERKRKKRRESMSDFFENVGEFFGRCFGVLLNRYVLLGIFFVVLGVVFALEIVGAAGNSFATIVMQQVTFYISIALFVADLVFFILMCNETIDVDDHEYSAVIYKVISAVLGVALFVMGCVTLGMGRLSFSVKSTYYDETNGVVYAELDTGYTVWEIKPEQENVTILAELDGLAVTGVHDGAAKNNNKMKTLTFAEDGIYALGSGSFAACSALTEIHFGGSSGSHIWKEVFKNCQRLTNVDCGTDNELIFDDWNAFADCPRLAEFHVNDSKLVLNTTLDIDCDKTLFGGETNAVFYVNGGDTSYIADNLGGVVVGKNSKAAVAHYTNNDGSIDHVTVGSYRFEEGFDFAGSTFFTVAMHNYVFKQEIIYQALADEIYLPSSVTYIPDNFFGNEGDGCTVYYAGTQEQWEALEVGQNGNDNFLKKDKVSVFYNSQGE